MMRFSFLTFTLLLSSCVSLPGSDKKAFIVVSKDQEAAMGLQAFNEIKAKEKISTDPRLNAILQRVGKRIAAVTPVKDYKWEFVLIESKEMNAFCLPGGKVAFYTGILPVLENEAAMAIVMGHEISHAVLRHGAQRISQAMALQGGLAVLDAAVLKDSQHRGLIMAGLGMGAQVGVLLPFSRAHESEADETGIRYAAAAGYDPAEGPRFWTRFSKITEGGAPPAFLSTHPSSASRIERLKELQHEAEGLYESSEKHGLGENL
ncbi:MAG: M48 family metallopeptidase [Bdellovibrionota bacterium]